MNGGGEEAAAEVAYHDVNSVLVLDYQSINHFVIYFRELDGRCLGKEITAYGRARLDKRAKWLGPL